MTDIDLDILELLVAIVGSVATVAGVVMQFTSRRPGRRIRQPDPMRHESPGHPKQPADGKPQQ